jgi:hypothetical protein
MVLLLVSVPILLQLRSELTGRGNYLALIGLVFPLLGLGMAVQWVLTRLRQRKFAGLRLSLPAIPVPLGAKLSGRIEGDFQLPPGVEVELVLSCVRSYVSGSGTDRPRWQTVLWQDKRTAAALAGGPRLTAIPVEFTIPYDARQTDSRNRDDEIFWRLRAAAGAPGLDFQCAFIAPVFQTPAGDPRLTIAAVEAESIARHGRTKPSDSAIVSEPRRAEGVRFYLPPARHKAIAATLTIFGFLTLGSGLFFGYGLGTGLWWMAGLLPLLVMGPLGLLLLSIAFGMWFGATTVEVIRGELHIRTSYLMFSRSRVLRKEDIGSFELHCGIQRGDEVWYDLRARLKTGRKRHIAGGMEKAEAEWFRAEIARDMRI